MSIFTVAECDEMIEALKCRLIEDPGGALSSITINGRTVSYADAEDLEKRIRMFQRLRSEAVKAAAGVGRTSMSVASFR